ncbi:MAG TPA: PIN domain-containing protein [Bacteroidia bacterium]|nr:PIN domain-containing protein [Bacteroidia bacterium]
MKKEFIGYYNPTEKEINDAWKNGAFAFDTNTLLNLYRYTELTRKDFLSSLKTVKERLFLPHQAALEFHSNRLGVIDGIEYAYSNLQKVFEENFEKILIPQINSFKKHPSIIIENISKLHSEFLKKLATELDKQKKNHPDFKTKDEVLDRLTELFENSTGKEFSKEELKKIFIEGKERYSENIPPGFKDLANKQKKGERHIYGDLIIWKELINYSKKEKKPLIFVTDDRKEDWWTIENGKTIRPREELIKEFFDLTGIRILIYNADHFLQYAKEKKLVPKLNDNTIKEVKEIRVSDEKLYSNINEFATYKSALAEKIFAKHSDLYKSSLVEQIAANQSNLYKPSLAEQFLVNQSNLYKPSLAEQILAHQSNLYKPSTAEQILAHQYKIDESESSLKGNQSLNNSKEEKIEDSEG